MDYSQPGFSVHGMLQARILRWVAVPFSRGSSQPRDQTHISYVSCIGRQILLSLCHLGSLRAGIVAVLVYSVHFSSVQFSCSVMSDSATPWITARQAPLSITNSRSSLRLMSIESVMPSNHLVLCHPLLPLPSIFPSIRFFLTNWLYASDGQSIRASPSASVLPMTIQDWFTVGLTGWISSLSKRLSGVFSNTTVQKNQLFGAQSFLRSKPHIHTWLLEKP